MQRNTKKNKVIAIMLDEIGMEFSKELIKDVIDAIPNGENIRLVTLVGKYIDVADPNDSTRMYKRVYNSIFELGELCDIDGAIIHLGSLSKSYSRIINSGYLKHFLDIPKVFVRSDIEGETVINYNNEPGIREAVEYLVNVEGLTKFCMLGGRDDNFDANSRKEIFTSCLAENNISFCEKNYQKTGMSENTEREADILLNNNPDVQAIFCVNDAVAQGLYAAMKKRELLPGKDIFIFAFDNTHISSEVYPTLSSIGADKSSLGRKAMEVLLDKLKGREVSSELVHTKLYSRESLYYEMYEYTILEMRNMDADFIYRMFDDCFYRYGNADSNRENINLKRLFYEYISEMLFALRRKYMDREQFERLCGLINIFFENGGMNYTDATKILSRIDRLQGSMNLMAGSSSAITMINRLFTHMKDRVIYVLSEQRINEKSAALEHQKRMQDFMVECSEAKSNSPEDIDYIFRNIDKLGIDNGVVYLFENPVEYNIRKYADFPEYINLRCAIRSGEIYVIPKERQKIPLREIFVRNELPAKCRGYSVFSLFDNALIYGFLLCEINDDTCDRGEYLSMELANAISRAGR